MYVGLQLPSFWKNKGRPNLFYHVLDTNVYQCGLKGGDPTERICFTHHVLHPEQQAVYKFLLLELLNWNVWTELYPQVCSFSRAPLPLLRWIYFHIMFKGLPPPLFMYTVSHGKPGNEASLGSNLKWLLRYHVGAHDVTLVELTGLGVRQLVGALDGLVPSPSWWASFRPQV